MRCRGEHCSPVLGVCCKFRIVGDDALGVPTLLSAHSCDIRTMFGAL